MVICSYLTHARIDTEAKISNIWSACLQALGSLDVIADLIMKTWKMNFVLLLITSVKISSFALLHFKLWLKRRLLLRRLCAFEMSEL